MASANGTTIPEDPTKVADETVDVKGKGKAVATAEPVDQSMDEDDDDDSGDEEVSLTKLCSDATIHKQS
jgi:hypothetical protein